MLSDSFLVNITPHFQFVTSLLGLKCYNTQITCRRW